MSQTPEIMDKFYQYKNALSKTQIKSFFTKGYVIVKYLFSKEEIAKIKEDIEDAFHDAKIIVDDYKMHTKATNTVLNKQFRCQFDGVDGNSASILAVNNDDNSISIKLISWIGGVKSDLITFGRDERITVPVAQLLGSNKGDHLINQAHYKMPNDKVSFNWHQDIQHRRSFDPNWKDCNGKGSFVQVLTAIDAVNNMNGPLIIVPGSHKDDLALDTVEITNYEAEIKKKYSDLEHIAYPLLLEPGDTLFMHPLLLHKSDSNISNSTREMFINGFSYPGANQKPYPGHGSANEISFNIPEDLLRVTQEFVSEILVVNKNV